MLGTYPPKSSTATSSKQTLKAAKPRVALLQKSEAGVKTRSASSRRATEQPPTITFIGRAASDSDLAASSSTHATRSRRPAAPSKSVKPAVEVFPKECKKENLSTSSSSSAEQSMQFAGWITCIETCNQIGAIAKQDSKYIRRLKGLHARRPNNYEKEVANEEQLTLIATRFLTKRNNWSLNACHTYLPIIIENIISENKKNRYIALDGLESISDTWLERIAQMAEENMRRIGVDVAAEERHEKAKFCVKQFRDLVQKRDALYKQLDEESIYKLDNIFARLKKV
ncbi:hypothetical protein CAEBREN_08113 [Caenorhabditis brenneri]|uniref:Katanin p80 subunit C-terminal domain-containing protein n=1 Tax=Caenorhabditis brenneri TaxID=135651 RepID=G0NK40_CAEBE|nr:hypothetical protein CAEBREN_08113 [Caenorhabditis brenneri]